MYRRSAQLFGGGAKDSGSVAEPRSSVDGGDRRGRLRCWRTTSQVQGNLTVEEKLYRDGRVSAFAVAKACALAGKRQLALHYLGIAFQRRESAMMALRAESGCSLQSLRDHASFRNLIARVGRSPI